MNTVFNLSFYFAKQVWIREDSTLLTDENIDIMPNEDTLNYIKENVADIQDDHIVLDLIEQFKEGDIDEFMTGFWEDITGELRCKLTLVGNLTERAKLYYFVLRYTIEWKFLNNVKLILWAVNHIDGLGRSM